MKKTDLLLLLLYLAAFSMPAGLAISLLPEGELARLLAGLIGFPAP